MQIIFIMIFMASAFLIQFLFGFFQIRHFTKAYTELRKLGKVAIGRRPGKIRSGTIVLFALAQSGRILKAKKIQGVTVMARVKDLKGFEGKNIKTLNEADMAKCNKLLRLAILDAVNNYNIIMKGGQIPEQPSFFKRVINQANHLVTSKK
ncbi:transcriptional regulator GutM [Heyndrickxia acidiproducens]|uniref:transcriptional regulator GutM n=1 Tax=Heyndrickxia acidiproducens TaxID=1121084 RepID=UPI00036ECBE4|nr:transcriptional regulator GutM [Heyndrickxia acidiproducens]